MSGFFGSFSKKDKDEGATPQAATGSPPAIPAGAPGGVEVKTPQPSSGLAPVSAKTGLGNNVLTTQPMNLPKPVTGGNLRPAKPSTITASKSTQRIVLPGKGDSPAASGGMSADLMTGNINLPVGIIVRVMPAEALQMSVADFEKSSEATQEVSLPLSLILPQIPTGKVEISIQDLVPHMPMTLLKPAGEITALLSTNVVLPLMDVVMRIPSEQMTVRADQKPVDPSILNMADPFSLEVLREQAEAARKAQSQLIPTTNNELKKATQPLSLDSLPPGAVTPGMVKTGPLQAKSGPIPQQPPQPPPPPFVKSGPLPPKPATGGLPPAPPKDLPPMPQEHIPTIVTGQKGLTAAKVSPPPAGSTLPLPRVGNAPPPLSTASQAVPPPPPPPVKGATSQVPKVEPPPVPRPASVPLPTPEAKAPEAPAPQAPALSEAESMRKLLEQAEEALGETAGDASAPEPAAAELPPKKTPTAFVPPVPQSLQRTEGVAVSQPPAMTAGIKESGKDSSASSMEINLNNCTAENLQRTGCSAEVAKAIVEYRTKNGPFRNIEDLLKVPGVTATTFTTLTGMEMEDGPTLNEVLGFSSGREVTLKDVADRICCWPDVSGCVLAQENGLPLVGTVQPPLDVKKVSAFLPKLCTAVNGVYKEMTNKEADEVIVPVKGMSFHVLRKKQMYMLIVGNRRQLPKRLLKVARYVLSTIEAKHNK